MTKRTHLLIRKSHRFLGLLLGIQFLFWTIGGLYFSWSNMDQVHGDLQKRAAVLMDPNLKLTSPTDAINKLKKVYPIDSIISLQIVLVLKQPFYQIRCLAPDSKNILVNAVTGEQRGPLNKYEVIEVAKERFNGRPQVLAVEYINSTNGHHEYRDNPLPAFAITFNDKHHTTVYVATELGTVQKFRNNEWRVFDFLWMMHTMDYQKRDHIGNLLLKSFSIFGLITILSGFALYFISAKWIRN